MSGHNKERIIGSSILLGGGLLLSAVFYRMHATSEPQLTTQQPDQSAEVVQIQPKKDHSTMGELTADYQTERRILAQKKEERAARVAKQERMVKDYLRVQEAANAKALRKADKEFSTDMNDITAVAISKMPQDVEFVKESAPQPKQHSKQQERLAKQKERTAAQKKQADQMQARLEKQKQENLAAKRKQQEQKQSQASYVAARQKLKDARAKAIMQGEKGDFGVQVAMAGNQALADDMAARIKKYGYQVRTSQTTRGVRVIVGHERGKSAAIALKDKVNADARLGLNGAWVMRLKPEHLKPKKQVVKKQPTTTQQTKKSSVVAAKASTDTKTKVNEKATEDKSRYGVQVAMAGTKEAADRLIAKLEKNGYKVTTSNTTRGTRIIVGAGLKKEAAQKLQAKVNSDSRVGVSGAWMRRER